MARAARRSLARLPRGFAFDLIDAHFAYPDGVAAAHLARRLGKPFVMTCRGEDILRFPKLPLIGTQIRGALQQAAALVALSGEIAEAMLANGADAGKITVIPNGVDCGKFCMVDRDEARRRLGLPQGRPVVLSVGYRLERKGFHILIDAIPMIRERFPELLVVIVGGPARWGQDYTSVIEGRIRANNVQDHVRLVGPRPPEQLSDWYSAADLFALVTSREGCPNALLEALACGLPAAATAVGGIPEILADAQLGTLLPDRSAAAAARAITAALLQRWDRAAIRRQMMERSWQAVAERVGEVFDCVLANAGNT
jgi:glycosyltransferase involved in cell wall biosynthesis